MLPSMLSAPEMHACMVLPGWMWGPADIGLSFRALELTLTDTVAWYRDHDWFENHSAPPSPENAHPSWPTTDFRR